MIDYLEVELEQEQDEPAGGVPELRHAGRGGWPEPVRPADPSGGEEQADRTAALSGSEEEATEEREDGGPEAPVRLTGAPRRFLGRRNAPEHGEDGGERADIGMPEREAAGEEDARLPEEGGGTPYWLLGTVKPVLPGERRGRGTEQDGQDIRRAGAAQLSGQAAEPVRSAASYGGAARRTFSYGEAGQSGAGGQSGAAALYAGLVRSRSAAAGAVRQAPVTVAVPEGAGTAAGEPLPSLRALDRGFQRDARRYDGGFTLF